MTTHATSRGNTGTIDITIRPAAPTECDALSALAVRSKGHWGYDAAFLEACRDELTVRADQLADLRVTIAADNAELLGFYALRGGPPDAELALLFVEPTRIGAGVGTALWNHCLVTARRLGLARIWIESDPFAERFYLTMGATRFGEAPSQSIPGRRLPLLTFDLEPTLDA